MEKWSVLCYVEKVIIEYGSLLSINQIEVGGFSSREEAEVFANNYRISLSGSGRTVKTIFIKKS